MAKYTGTQSKRKPPSRGAANSRAGLVSDHCIAFAGPLPVDFVEHPPVQCDHVAVGGCMFRRLIFSCLIQAALVTVAVGAGPYGTIRVGAWMGGAYTDDNTGAFSHCAATSAYASGVSLVVGLNSANAWLLGFASPSFHYKTGDSLAIDVTFDGQSQARLFATANSPVMATAILPANVARTFQKASLMVASTDGAPFQFNLTSTAPLLAALATCATKVKAEGIKAAGDFSNAKIAAAKPAAAGSDAATS
jgi:hypothetical protein